MVAFNDKYYMIFSVKLNKKYVCILKNDIH